MPARSQIDFAPLDIAFAPPVREPIPLRTAITAAYRRPEMECVLPLLEQASVPDDCRERISATARILVTALRAKKTGSGIEGLVHEFALTSQEGVALMCLAEALLRIPDSATRDALIRDKLANGDWKAHLGDGRPLFVNAATWGLVVTGKLLDSINDRGLGAALTRLVARAGEPVIRRAVDLAMRTMGEKFVMGETIEAALRRSRDMQAKGFTYSFDMLGEAAMTDADAARYLGEYETAIRSIGRAAKGRDIYQRPGISIKLSALHPRYSRAQADRVFNELLPRMKALAALAKHHAIGFNIDAEEADRLELSLDLLESLALEPELSGWDGLGFVVQAYGKRCPFVIDWLVDLAQRSGRRIMVRLVKGAYWDSEIKRAQVDGLADFPVYTRKPHTDVAYLACARKLLAAKSDLFPQFATHNAQTLAAVYHMAGPDFVPGDYEFQCLHGMGEPLYDEVVGPGKLNRPCRIYAPVGTHETLLAYLVRRLLENGANSSFVHRIRDATVSLDDLVADPVANVRSMRNPGAPHDEIALPKDLLGDRPNSEGLDLTDESVIERVASAMRESARIAWTAGTQGTSRSIRNPADHREILGTVCEVDECEAAAYVARAAHSDWPKIPVAERAATLERTADALQARMPAMLGLLAREAGKSVPNAIGEVREAIDFLRYYARQARETLAGSTPLGPLVCISPWNFPLAIFTGQVAAALAAGNPVLAKPAEETPLVAAEAVRLLHAAGVPNDALQLVCGAGEIGAALVGAAETAGVIFTGSTEVARLIQRQLATRLSADGQPLVLIAETGGQNAMIVDSSALSEQVVGDVIASAFDSAGQRCSALRVLCLQEEIADRTLDMLRGALQELRVGRPDKLSTDVGPVISIEAKHTIEAHIACMRQRGHAIHQQRMLPETEFGTFVAPTIIELSSIDELQREVFGPVLHVIRYRRAELDQLLTAINASGNGLTFGLHTRLETTIDHVASRIKVGNIYVNRNIIGAIVGVQPFGGRGLSGTGPKAGGPLYLNRLLKHSPSGVSVPHQAADDTLPEFAAWLEREGNADAAILVREIGTRSPLGYQTDLPGPVGERNVYALYPRGTLLLRPQTSLGLIHQVAATLATGNEMAIEAEASLLSIVAKFPPGVQKRFRAQRGAVSAVLIEGGDAEALAAVAEMAALPGAVIPIHVARTQDITQPTAYCADWLVEEVSTSINTTAAGGNASLVALG